MKITFVDPAPKRESIWYRDLAVGQAMRWKDTGNVLICITDNLYLKLYSGNFHAPEFKSSFELNGSGRGQLIDGEVNIEVTIR